MYQKLGFYQLFCLVDVREPALPILALENYNLRREQLGLVTYLVKAACDRMKIERRFTASSLVLFF